MSSDVDVRCVLAEARRLIAVGWTQYVCARDEMGERVSFRDERAVSFDLGGALARAAMDENVEWEARYRPVRLHVEKVLGAEAGWPSFAGWNDRPGRTQAEVLGFLDRCIVALDEPAEGEGAAA